MVIDETNKQLILKEYYLKARAYINNATPEKDSDQDTLTQVEADLDMLVRSQQTTPVLGEIFRSAGVCGNYDIPDDVYPSGE